MVTAICLFVRIVFNVKSAQKGYKCQEVVVIWSIKVNKLQYVKDSEKVGSKTKA